MPDVIKERLELIIEHAAVIEERIAAIKKAEDLNASKPGRLLLDSLITRLQALAENIKKIQRLDPSFFQDSLPLDVVPIIRFRDFVSHHYELLNHEIIFVICKTEIPDLKIRVQTYLKTRSQL